MSGTCAVCVQPISKGDQFSLVGCESIHRACLPNMERSRSNIAAAKIVRLTAEVARERSLGATGRVELDRAINEARSARKARDIALADLASARSREEAAVAVSQQALAEVRAVRRQRDEMKDVATRAVGELHLQTVLAGGGITDPTGQTSDGHGSLPGDNRDDSEVRFSLLEFDHVHTTEIAGGRDATAETEETEETQEAEARSGSKRDVGLSRKKAR